MLTYILEVGESIKPENIVELAKCFSPQTEEKIVTVAEYFENRGKEKWIEHGIQQGMQQGMQQGEYALLLRLLERKFGYIPDVYQQKMREAGSEVLLRWSEQLLNAKSLEEIFGEV